MKSTIFEDTPGSTSRLRLEEREEAEMPPKKQDNAEAAQKKGASQPALKRDKSSVSPLGGGGPLGKRPSIAPRLVRPPTPCLPGRESS